MHCSEIVLRRQRVPGLTVVPFLIHALETRLVGDGDSQDSLAQKAHEARGFREVILLSEPSFWYSSSLTLGDADDLSCDSLPDYCKSFCFVTRKKVGYSQCLFGARYTVTYRATDSPARSNCSLTCKFSYLAPGTRMKDSEGVESTSTGWSNSFLSKIGVCPFFNWRR